MTTSQVLRAGRELDALVAEKVFQETGPHRIMPEYDLPPFSTDMGAAWQVVEKLLNLYEDCQFTMKYRQGYDPDFWLVGWQVHRENGWQWSDAFGKGEAPTLPLAVCRLAVQQ